MGESFDYFRICVGLVMLRKKDKQRVITLLIPYLVVGGNLMQRSKVRKLRKLRPLFIAAFSICLFF